MVGLVELQLNEELAVFDIESEETACFTMEKDKDSEFSLSSEASAEFHYDEELCEFTLVINTDTEDDIYEPLYCLDGIVRTSDGNPIYVLKWRIGMN